jgi:peptide/nickel transport system permease protein
VRERSWLVTGYILRRIGIAIVIVFGVSIFTFGMLHIIYPSPVYDVLGPKASPPAIAGWNKANGFDEPWIEQYLRYLGNVLHGNFGQSYKFNQSVYTLFANRWARSAYLSGISLVIAVLLAVPLGIYQAVKRNTVGDYAATSFAFIVYSMPPFLLSIVLIDVFALRLHWFNFEASQSLGLLTVMGDWRSMFLPIMSLVLLTVAAFSRYMRSSSMDVLAQDYIKVARAKGLPERLVLFRHLVRNACLPVVTLIGLFIPVLLAGNLITEQVFNFQGLGLLFFNALGQGDYNVLLAYTLVGALLTVLGNLVADVALTVADPRIRLR